MGSASHQYTPPGVSVADRPPRPRRGPAVPSPSCIAPDRADTVTCIMQGVCRDALTVSGSGTPTGFNGSSERAWDALRQFRGRRSPTDLSYPSAGIDAFTCRALGVWRSGLAHRGSMIGHGVRCPTGEPCSQSRTFIPPGANRRPSTVESTVAVAGIADVQGGGRRARAVVRRSLRSHFLPARTDPRAAMVFRPQADHTQRSAPWAWARGAAGCP